MRTIVGTVAVLLAACAPAAQAAERHAAPTGSGTACTPGDPCSLGTALTGPGTVAGDEVILAAGDYGTPADPLSTTIARAARVTLRGADPADRPRIWLDTVTADSTLTGLVLSGTSNVVRDVEVRNVATGVGGQALFVGNGATVERVVATVAGLSSTATLAVGYALAGNGSNTVLRNTVLLSQATETPEAQTFPASAAVLSNAGGGVTLRHVTAASRAGVTLDLRGTGPNPASFTIANTLVAGTGASVLVQKTASGSTAATFTASVLNTGASAIAGATLGGSPTIGAASLVDVFAGDVRQRPDSALTIDQGAVDAANGSTDIGGDPRLMRGAPDVGADEIPPPPTATVDTVEDITTGGATVKATLDPSGGATTYRLEFGTGSAFDRLLPGPGPVAALDGPQSLSFPLTGLAADTVHQARLVAVSDGGTTTSTAFGFRTAAPAPAVPPTTGPSAPAPGPGVPPGPTPTPAPPPAATPVPAVPASRRVSCTQARRATGRGKARRFAIACTIRPSVARGPATLRRGTSPVIARATTASGRVTFRVRTRQRAGRYRVTLRTGGRSVTFTVTLR